MFRVVRTLLFGGFVGKLLGVTRELIFAWLFGTGAVASAYRLAQSAFLIPLHGIFSETIAGGFTPRYATDRIAAPGRAAALFSGLYSLLLIASVAVAVALFAGAPLWVRILAPGFDPERAETAVLMLRILSLALPAYAVFGLFASVDLAAGRGALSAMRASLQSIGLILGTLSAYVFSMPSLVAVGFVLAYVSLAIVGSRTVRADGLSLGFASLRSSRPEVLASLGRLGKVVGVLVWIPIAFQINSVVEKRVASIVSVDAMAAVDYARFVSETLVILAAVPFGLAGLSTLGTMDRGAAELAQIRSFRALLYVGVPLSAFLFLNAHAFVELVFARGAFGQNSIDATGSIMAGMAVGVWGQLVGYAGVKFLSARGRNLAALSASLAGVFASVVVLVSLQSTLGVSVLGFAAGVQGVVFGVVAAVMLSAVRPLAVEAASLTALTALYTVLSEFADQTIKPGFALVFLIWGAFWAASLLLLPWHRRGAVDSMMEFHRGKR
jgi:putative peptidoglycan lipid II flippase